MSGFDMSAGEALSLAEGLFGSLNIHYSTGDGKLITLTDIPIGNLVMSERERRLCLALLELAIDNVQRSVQT